MTNAGFKVTRALRGVWDCALGAMVPVAAVFIGIGLSRALQALGVL